MMQHVFVAILYGTKEGIDSNKVYTDFIKLALEKEGFEVFRADEELSAGNIRTDMFQEFQVLLLADLVVADLYIDNPNVWYELGIRHALRARDIIQIKCKRDYMPFDVYTDRTLTYHVKNGTPDPDFMNKDMEKLVVMSRENVSFWHGRKISPMYHLLRYLKEPGWKSLRVNEAKEFWEKQDAWERRIEIACKRKKPGDILVLADEAPIRSLRLEAHQAAGKALLKLGQFSLELEQIENTLYINPKDLESLQQKGIILGWLKEHDTAKEWLEATVRDYPKSAETWALLGRVEKDAWVNAWRRENKTQAEMTEEAAYEDSLLREAIGPYLKGFLLDPDSLNLEKPKALILIFGDASGLDESLRPHLMHLFSGDIARAAIETDIIIMDGGTKAGVI